MVGQFCMKLLDSPVSPTPDHTNCPDGGTGLPIDDTGDIAHGAIKAALLLMEKDLSSETDHYYTGVKLDGAPLCYQFGTDQPERQVDCVGTALSFCFRQGDQQWFSCFAKPSIKLITKTIFSDLSTT